MFFKGGIVCSKFLERTNHPMEKKHLLHMGLAGKEIVLVLKNLPNKASRIQS